MSILTFFIGCFIGAFVMSFLNACSINNKIEEAYKNGFLAGSAEKIDDK